MTTKAFPSVADELAPPSKPKLNLRSMRAPVVADETVAANSEALGQEWQASTSLPAAPRIKPMLVSLRAEIPVSVDEAISRAAFERRVTKNFLMLEALRQAGYPVEDADLVADGRKARRRRTP